jgi:hypothetical protein
LEFAPLVTPYDHATFAERKATFQPATNSINDFIVKVGAIGPIDMMQAIVLTGSDFKDVDRAQCADERQEKAHSLFVQISGRKDANDVEQTELGSTH